MILFIIIVVLAGGAALWFVPGVRERVAAIFRREAVCAGEEADDRPSSGTPSAGELSELTKYIARFGVVLMIVAPIVWCLMGPQAVRTLFYKVCLVTTGLGLGEVLWFFFYKLVFKKVEALNEYERRTVLMFRGALYIAVILGITWGL